MTLHTLDALDTFGLRDCDGQWVAFRCGEQKHSSNHLQAVLVNIFYLATDIADIVGSSVWERHGKNERFLLKLMKLVTLELQK